MGIPFPEEYGGAGSDSLAYAIAVEELTRVDSSVAITLCAHTSLGTQPIYLFGSEEQKQEWLPRLCSGRDARRLRPDRARSGLGCRQHAHAARRSRTASGSSTGPSSSSPTPAPTSPAWSRSPRSRAATRAAGARSPTCSCPNGTPGYVHGEPYRKMGWNASDTRPLTFEDCRVPEELPARPARRRLQAVPARARHRPHRRRGDGRRAGAGRARPGARVREGAQGVRPADLEVPGDPGQARRHGD